MRTVLLSSLVIIFLGGCNITSGLGPSGLAANKILYGDSLHEIIAFESEDINKRDNYFGFWLTDWMKPFENIIEKKWYKWTIGSNNLDITHTSLDKPYCVISFKTWKKFCLETKNNLEIVNKQVVQYFPEQNYFKIITADIKYIMLKTYMIHDQQNKKKVNCYNIFLELTLLWKIILLMKIS